MDVSMKKKFEDISREELVYIIVNLVLILISLLSVFGYKCFWSDPAIQHISEIGFIVSTNLIVLFHLVILAVLIVLLIRDKTQNRR